MGAAENARRTCNDVEVSLQNAAKDRKEMEVSFKEESERIKNEMKQEHDLIQKAKLDAEEKLVKMTKHVGKLERMKIDSEQELKRINEELIEANDQKGKTQRSLEATLSKLEEVTVELKSRMDSEQVLKVKLLETENVHKEDIKNLESLVEKSTKQEEKTQSRCDELLQKLDIKKNEISKMTNVNSAMKKELKEMTDEAAQQVFAFQGRTKELTEEIHRVEDEKADVEERLQSTQSLLANAVKTIEDLQDELQSGDADNDKAFVSMQKQVESMEVARQEDIRAATQAEERESVVRQDLKRCERKMGALEKENRTMKAELEEKRNEYQNLQRKFSHLQRDTDNARTIEQNMSKFLKNMYTNSTASTNSNNNGVAIE